MSNVSVNASTDAIHSAATTMVADWNGVTRATIEDALAAGNPYVQLHYRRALKVAEAAATADTQPPIVTQHPGHQDLEADTHRRNSSRLLAERAENHRLIPYPTTRITTRIAVPTCFSVESAESAAAVDNTTATHVASSTLNVRKTDARIKRCLRNAFLAALLSALFAPVAAAYLSTMRHGQLITFLIDLIAASVFLFSLWKAMRLSAEQKNRSTNDQFQGERFPNDCLSDWRCSASLDENDSHPNTLVGRLANGYFTQHPLQGMAALFIGFVLACSAAPAFELLLGGH